MFQAEAVTPYFWGCHSRLCSRPFMKYLPDPSAEAPLCLEEWGLKPFPKYLGFCFLISASLALLASWKYFISQVCDMRKSKETKKSSLYERHSTRSLPDLYVQLIHESYSLLIWYPIFQLYQRLSHLMCFWMYSGMRMCDNIFSTAEMCIFFHAYIIKNGWKRLWLSFVKNSN